MTLLLCCLFGSEIARADSSSATLSVSVTDATGAIVPGAVLVVRNVATNQTQQLETKDSGSVSFPFLKPGTYQLTVRKSHFADVVVTGLVLNVGDNRHLDIQLKVGSESQTVSVNGSGLTLNTTDASVSTVIDRQFVENMPLNGRSLQSLIALTPGVVQTPLPYGSSAGNSGEFSVNGQRTESNYYSVDGVSATVGVGSNSTYTAGAGGSLPNQTALGTTQSIASLDALQEFRITTSTYSAEYGRTPGGQISLQTRSGTNAFHGTVFDYFRNDALDANNWFNDHTRPKTAKTAERQNDFGGTLGGPLVVPHLYAGRDKSFFFYSYEGLRLSVPTPATTTQVPDSTLRQLTPTPLKALINAFPVPNGSEVTGVSGLAYFTGAYSLPSSLDTHSVRIDHNISKTMQLFGRFADSGSSSESRSQSDLALLTNQKFISRVVTAGLTHSITPHSVNDLRYNYTWTATAVDNSVDSFGGATTAGVSTFLSGVPQYSAAALYLNWGGTPHVTVSKYNIGETQLNLVDKLSFQIGRHSFTAGADYRRITLNNAVNEFVAYAGYSSATQIQNNSAGSGYANTAGTTPAEPIFQNISTFLQDEWKVRPSTTVSLGIRWDLNPPPSNGNGRLPPTLNETSDLTTAQLLPTGTAPWNTDYSGFAPRIGIAYQLRGERGHETVLRSGFGMFYDTGNTLAAMGFTLLGFGSRQNYTSISFPLPASFYTLPAPSTSAPYTNSLVAFNRNLRLPFTYQWNIAIEQAFGTSRSFTISYVAAAGDRLLQGSYLEPSTTIAAFANGYGLYTVQNSSWSNYNSLQAQFQQHLASGLQILAAYTWSHSIDNLSTSYVSYQPLLKGDSDFDVRSNFQAALTYNIPSRVHVAPVSFLTKNWSIDLRAFSRTAAPVDIYGTSYIAADGTQQYARPNIVSGTPFYIYGSRSAIPGGRQINFSAFQTVSGSVGTAPRNFLRGFGANELDVAFRREFDFSERFKMQFRAESFNLLNHPAFGAIYNTMNYGPSQFGLAYNTLNVNLKNENALYAQGGPRSLQLALKILF
jgi:hypothetical protein